MDKKKIVMFGSYVCDLTGTADGLPTAGATIFGEFFKTGPGGKGSNQAVAAHRADADITVVTKIGKDLFGQQVIDFYNSEGIATDYVFTDDEKGTGIALICVDEKTKQNQILVVPGACTNFTDADIAKIEPLVKAADILLVQFEVNMDALERVMKIAKDAGVMIVLNPAPARKVSREFLALADVITPNEVEAETFVGFKVENEQDAKRAADVFHEWGIGQVIITMGKSGVFASTGTEQRMIAARIVEAVDTTGAGDAFNGGFVTALAEGKTIFEASEFGNALASLSVQRFGTAPSMPARSEIDLVL